MARDVEFNVTAADKTGPALAAAERHFARSPACSENRGSHAGVPPATVSSTA
jgi:hypothetical protein